ncbi:MAG: tetratricopeptide repeat protein [Phycisphaerae bacterium]|nr:tetratricopeptide repeat protein [Phycisphaerae bacterium]
MSERRRWIRRTSDILRRASRLAFCLLPLLVSGVGCAIGRPAAEMSLRDGDKAMAAADFDAALKAYQKAVKLDPAFPEAYTKLGVAYKEVGDLPEAETTLQKAVELDPKSYEPIFQLGEVYRLMDRAKQAIRAYLAAIEIDRQQFFAHFRLAGCYQQLEQYASAIESYRASLKIDPRNAYAWSNLGACYDADGDPYQAIASYKRSLECNVQQPLVLVNLATVYINQDRYDAGRRTLDAAIRIDPNVSVAHERLGYCHWREGAMDEAAREYAMALQLDRRNAAAYAGYGVVRMSQYLDTPARVALQREALEAWHRSLEINPDQPKIRELIDRYRGDTGTPPLDLAGSAPPGG